ncbi:MAG: hypothetical protein KDD38_01640 [Bdellovibrionales bacterium]|nr:hypothetical protein [Bdellovibrionales bacterium]
MNTKKVFGRLIAAVLALTGVFVLFGQGCGESFTTNNLSGGYSSENICTGPAKDIIDKNYEVVVGTRTVSVAYGEQLLDSYVSCTGIGSPSLRTYNEWQTRNQSLSEYGNLADVSGAMMMGVTAVATEACRDLIDKEMPLALNERGIFRSVNLQGTGLNQAEMTESINLLALSCWQRPATDEEKNLIVSTVSALGANSENGALGLCTAMLASLSAIEQ